MFGLGHYIYAGDDLPEVKPEPVVKKPLKVGDDNWLNILKFIGANKDKSLDDISKMVETKYKVTLPVKKALSNAVNPKKVKS